MNYTIDIYYIDAPTAPTPPTPTAGTPKAPKPPAPRMARPERVAPWSLSNEHVHVNPNAATTANLLNSDPEGSLRILAAGPDIAAARSYHSTHEDMLSSLREAAHPMAEHPALTSGQGIEPNWQIQMHNKGSHTIGPHRVRVIQAFGGRGLESSSGRQVPERHWPEALRRIAIRVPK